MFMFMIMFSASILSLFLFHEIAIAVSFTISLKLLNVYMWISAGFLKVHINSLVLIHLLASIHDLL